jgi:LacI family transcriptional regulator
MNEKGYSLLMASTDGNEQKEKECIEMMDAKRVDGLVICPVSPDIEKIVSNVSCPVVSFDRSSLNHIRDTVYVDKERSMYDAVAHLFQKGHKEIAVISGMKNLSTNFDRYHGYMRAHYDWDMIAHKENMYFGSFTKEYGKQSFEKLMKGGTKPTAIISGSADLTEGILAKAKELKVRIPEDISLISFGTLSFQDILDLRITYVDEMQSTIGEKIGKMILTRLRNTSIPARLEVLESGIVEGDSVKAMNDN